MEYDAASSALLFKAQSGERSRRPCGLHTRHGNGEAHGHEGRPGRRAHPQRRWRTTASPDGLPEDPIGTRLIAAALRSGRRPGRATLASPPRAHAPASAPRRSGGVAGQTRSSSGVGSGGFGLERGRQLVGLRRLASRHLPATWKQRHPDRDLRPAGTPQRDQHRAQVRVHGGRAHSRCSVRKASRPA
jgi:hypothetical protein